MNKMKKLGGIVSGFGLLAVSAFAQTAPTTMSAFQTSITGTDGTFSQIEGIAVKGFLLGAAIVVAKIALSWANRGARGKVK